MFNHPRFFNNRVVKIREIFFCSNYICFIMQRHKGAVNKQKANFHFVSSCVQTDLKLILIIKIAEVCGVKETQSTSVSSEEEEDRDPCERPSLIHSTTGRKRNEGTSAQSSSCARKQQNRQLLFDACVNSPKIL